MARRPRFPRAWRLTRRWAAPAVLVVLAALGFLPIAQPLAARRPAQGPSLNQALQVGGSVAAVAYEGNRVYVGVGPRVYIFAAGPDVPQPTLLATTEVLPGLVMGVTPHGDSLYVALGYGGLAVLDVTIPSTPRVIGRFVTEVAQVVVQEPYLYLTCGVDGGRIVDARNPADIKELGRIRQFARELAVSGNRAFALDLTLTMWDITNPAATKPMRELTDRAEGVAARGTIVYAATSEGAVGEPRSGWLRTWDVANPRQIRELGKVPLAGVGRFVRLVGEQLVVLSDTRLEVFDANDPIGLPKIHSAPALAEAVEADLVGDQAWLGAGVAGLRAVPLAGTGSAEGERLLNLPGRAETLALDGEKLYVEDADRRILVYRADEVPAGPIGELAEAVQSGAMVATGGYLYLGTQDRQLKIYDVRDAGRIQLAGSLSLPQAIARIAVTGGHAYLATDPFLRAVNVRDPAHPQVVSQVQLTGGVTDLAAEGAWLYAVGPNMGARPQPSLKSVDISEPRAPEERALVPALGSFGGLAVADRLVYVSGLQVVDACNPVAPVELSRLTTPGRPHDVAVDGWRVYLAKHGPLINGELQLVDARWPRRPVLAASQAPADAVDDVVAREGSYWASAREGGLLIGTSPDVYFPTPTPDRRPTATRPPGLDLTTYLPLVRFDRYVRPCPAP